MSAPLHRHNELIELAAVARAHGLRGELLLKPFNPASDLLGTVERVVLRRPDGRTSEHEVESAQSHGANALLALVDVRTREAAEALRGSLICVHRTVLSEPGEGEYYFADLVGLEVRDATGRVIGRVCDVLDYPSVSCLLVEGDEGQIEVPNTDRYVHAIEMDHNVVTVANIEELDVLRTRPGRGRR